MRVKYEIKKKLSSGQTLFLSFDYLGENKWNVVANIYSKRRKASNNEENCIITGVNCFENAVALMRGFAELERDVIEHENSGEILVGWTDKKRRDCYEKVLKGRGYRVEMRYGKKCLVRRF